MTEDHRDFFVTRPVAQQASHLDPAPSIQLVLEHPGDRTRRGRVTGVQDHVPAGLQHLAVLIGRATGQVLQLPIRVRTPKFQKGPLKLRICRLGRGMFGIPNTQLRTSGNRVIAFQHRLLLTQMKMPVDPVVEGGA